MLTRFTKTECPACHEVARPVHRHEINRSILELLPGVDILQDGRRMLTGTLHCKSCGRQLTESLAGRVPGFLDTAKSKMTAAVEDLKQPRAFCGQCGSAVQAGTKFCGQCGSACSP